MDHDNFQCSYCGSVASEWDHLRPLILNKKPTGFVSEIHNLVPACGKCNQSKDNKSWILWIVSAAKLSPKTRGITGLAVRIERLKRFEKWGQPTVVDFEAVVGAEKWKQHGDNWEHVQSSMRHAQELATEIKNTIAKSYEK